VPCTDSLSGVFKGDVGASKDVFYRYKCCLKRTKSISRNTIPKIVGKGHNILFIPNPWPHPHTHLEELFSLNINECRLNGLSHMYINSPFPDLTLCGGNTPVGKETSPPYTSHPSTPLASLSPALRMYRYAIGFFYW